MGNPQERKPTVGSNEPQDPGRRALTKLLIAGGLITFLGGTAVTAKIGLDILRKGLRVPRVIFDPEKIFPRLAETPHLLPKSETASDETSVGEKNFAEFFLGNLVDQFKQRRNARARTEPGFAERIDPQFLNSDQINFLYLGVDLTREKENEFNSEGQGLADMIMFTSFNPHNFKIGAISFPRDLFSPEKGAKINSLTAVSEPWELAKKIIESAAGVPVDGVIKTNIDFMQGYPENHLRQPGIFDELFPGGLKISVPKRLQDRTYPQGYGWQEVVFEAGEQVMKGPRLTKYARTRGADSDFDRSQRQREILLASTKALLPRILGDLAKGTTETLDLIVSAFQRQKGLANLFFDVNIIEILKTLREGLKSLREEPEGILVLTTLAANTYNKLGGISFDKETFLSWGPSRENGAVVNVPAAEATESFLLKPQGVKIAASPTSAGNYLTYWQPIRKKVKELLEGLN